MPSLQDLPLDIIHQLVQHVTYPKTPSNRKEAVSLSSTCKILRGAIFASTCLKEVVLDYSRDELERTRQVLSLSMRKKVKELTIKGDCSFSATKPTLQNYIELFPKAVSISLKLVYPQDPSTHHQLLSVISPNSNATSKQPRPSPVRSVNALKAVSLSITRSPGFHGTTHERYIAKLIPHLQASLKAVKVDRLEDFHLDVATSRLKEDRRDPGYWTVLGKRLGGAVAIPTRNVSLTIGEIRIDGEAPKFLDMLGTAIKCWPKRIERISLEVYTDDFGSDKRNKDKFKITKKGRVALTPDWLPTEKDMNAFVGKVQKNRSNLQEVHLVIRARTTVFASDCLLSKEVLRFTFIKHRPAPALSERIPNVLGTKDQPIDLEDLNDITCARPTSETKTTVHQSVIDALYQAMQEHQQMCGSDIDEDDSFDETDAEIEAMQERSDEMDASLEEDEEDWRPRWVAI